MLNVVRASEDPLEQPETLDVMEKMERLAKTAITVLPAETPTPRRNGNRFHRSANATRHRAHPATTDPKAPTAHPATSAAPAWTASPALKARPDPPGLLDAPANRARKDHPAIRAPNATVRRDPPDLPVVLALPELRVRAARLAIRAKMASPVAPVLRATQALPVRPARLDPVDLRATTVLRDHLALAHTARRRVWHLATKRNASKFFQNKCSQLTDRLQLIIVFFSLFEKVAIDS